MKKIIKLPKELEKINFYNKLVNTLVKELKYTRKQSREIIDLIEQKTNENYNFDMYFDYREEVEQKYIDDFINQNRNKFNNIEEAKQGLREYIEEKYDFFNDSLWYYEDELSKDINLDFVKDTTEIIQTLQDEYGILYLDYDIFDACKSEYKVRIYDKSERTSTYTNLFNEGNKAFKNREEFEEEFKNEEEILQKLCISNGFKLKELFTYALAEKGSYEDEKGIRKRKENQFFNDLYREFNNSFDYSENLYFLTYLDLEDMLSFCVKDTSFNFNRLGSLGLYCPYVGSGSVFEITNRKDCLIKTSDLGIDLFNCTKMDEVYGFTNEVFTA